MFLDKKKQQIYDDCTDVRVTDTIHFNVSEDSLSDAYEGSISNQSDTEPTSPIQCSDMEMENNESNMVLNSRIRYGVILIQSSINSFTNNVEYKVLIWCESSNTISPPQWLILIWSKIKMSIDKNVENRGGIVCVGVAVRGTSISTFFTFDIFIFDGIRGNHQNMNLI